MPLSLRSPAFDSGHPIPDRHAKASGNVAPPLEWSDPPQGTRGFALVVEDPDAPSGTFRHWALFDIPADRTSLSEGEDTSGFGHGINDFGNPAYDGPRPPPGHGVHHYHFRLAALNTDRLPDLPPDPTAAAVWDVAQAHAIEIAETVGTFVVPAPS